MQNGEERGEQGQALLEMLAAHLTRTFGRGFSREDLRPLAVKNPETRAFHEREALRGGWSVRQLDRQIGSQFYERGATGAEVSVNN